MRKRIDEFKIRTDDGREFIVEVYQTSTKALFNPQEEGRELWTQDGYGVNELRDGTYELPALGVKGRKVP
jgi:hypothetical protein